MIKRILSAIVFAALMLLCIVFQSWAMVALLCVFMLIATHEMYHALENCGIHPAQWAGYAFCVLAVAAHILSGTEMALMMCSVGLILGMTAVVLKGKVAAQDMIGTILPVMYPGVFFVLLLSLLNLENRAVSTVAFVLAFFSASINDVFALFSGLLFGKHKLSPEISPKKTIEGSIGGIIFCTIFTVAIPALVKLIFSFDPDLVAQMEALPPVWCFVPLGILLSLLSQIGDLTASMLKRHCGIKDFGRLMPGHGGIMDRLDGVLFCGAACAIFFRLIGLG